MLWGINFEWRIDESFRVRWLRRVEKILLRDLVVRRTLTVELLQTVVISILVPDSLGCMGHDGWLCLYLIIVKISDSKGDLLNRFVLHELERIHPRVSLWGELETPLIERRDLLMIHHLLNLCYRLVLALTSVVVGPKLLKINYRWLKVILAVLPSALHCAQLHHLVFMIIVHEIIPCQFG